VKEIVQRAIGLYRADGIGLADYALESSGTNFLHENLFIDYIILSNDTFFDIYSR